MTAFDVLQRTQPIHRHAMLEASAGTGKTFAIEHILVRLLIEPSDVQAPLTLESILVVTFTKAATRDLKERVRLNIEKTLQMVDEFLAQNSFKDYFPDYLVSVLEQGLGHAKRARRCLEQALYAFDQAQIFTIHGFCWRMLNQHALEGNIGLESRCREEQPSLAIRLLQAIKDFIRTELIPEKYSTHQLEILLKRTRNDITKLQKSLFEEISKGLEVKASPSFSELLKQFQVAMSRLKNEGISGQVIMEDFRMKAPYYNKICDRNKNVKPEILLKVQNFCRLFDLENWQSEDFELLIADGLYICEAFDESNLSAKKNKSPLPVSSFPNLIETLKNTLGTIVEQSRNPKLLFARLVKDCQQFMRRFQTDEELFGHTDLLLQMKDAITLPAFADRVREIYSAVIVDEFQDTDPIQWEIFDSLFGGVQAPWKGYLYLVGDPKQSIYAFRQADIYTYLNAAKRLGNEAASTLDTNYRSQPQLIEALNALFSSVEQLFPLPKLGKSLGFTPVKAGKKEVANFADGKPCLHFWSLPDSREKMTLDECQEKYLLPAAAHELWRLVEEDKIDFGQCAVLIQDKFQAAQVAAYLTSKNIPVKNQKAEDLSQSVVIDCMREVLVGIYNYRQSSSLKIALGGQVIGFTHKELRSLDQDESLNVLLQRCDYLRRILMEEGFGKFFISFMQSVWHVHGQTIGESLLSRVEGKEFYRQWSDVAELLMEEEATSGYSVEGLIAFLDDLTAGSSKDEEGLGYFDLDEKGVTILTNHSCKGLEFDIVFALGLIKPKNPNKQDLVISEVGGQQFLEALKEGDKAYIQHCQEMDAEKMRQLYVVLTRAKHRLYVPAIQVSTKHSRDIGWASPMDLLLAGLNRKQNEDYQGLYERLNNEPMSSSIKELVSRYPTIMHLEVLSNNREGYVGEIANESFALEAPQTVDIVKSPKVVQSFSSLSQGKNVALEESEMVAPHDFEALIKDEHTLPSGNETGNLLHLILERMPFGCVLETDGFEKMKSYINPWIERSPFVKWKEVIGKMVFQALTTPLPVEEPFCLGEIDPKRLYRETEFLYACKSGESYDQVVLQPGYLKGVIDTFFEYRGKYYLVDWKSNWLGPNSTYYHPEHLDKAMRSNQYDLQAQLYGEALRRYLNCFGIDFDEVFGGAFYFFMRGISPSTGIWCLQPYKRG